MAESYTVIQLQRYDDFSYLNACGLQVKQMEGNKQCRVVDDQLKMAKRFLKARRNSENLRQIRRNQQKNIDRREAFRNL